MMEVPAEDIVGHYEEEFKPLMQDNFIQVTSFIVFIFYCSGDGKVLQNTFKEETVFFVFPALDFIFRNVAYEGYDIISVEVDHAHCDI